MGCHGIRGATTVARNDAQEILAATRILLERMVSDNAISPEMIASVFFTATGDLDAVYPARAARELGWLQTPLLCARDMDVSTGVPRCVRVLLHANINGAPDRLHHVYLGDAQSLRPDWVGEVKT